MSYLYPPSNLDASQVLQSAFDDATQTLRTTAVATIITPPVIEVLINHVDDSIAIGTSTDLFTSHTVGSDVGLDVYLLNSDFDIRDLNANQDNVAISDGTDTLEINGDGSINSIITATDLDIRDLNFASDSVEVRQSVHDNLNGNMTIQVADVDVSNSNPVPVSDAGSSLTVDAIDFDIRDLVFATDKVDVTGSDITAIVSATDLDIRNLVFATDKVDVSGSSVTAVVSATDLDIRDLNFATDSVEVRQTIHDNLNANANIQVSNTDVSNANPVPVSDAGSSLTVDGTVTSNQGTPNTNANGWFVRITDGTDNALVTTTGELNVLSTAQPGVDIGDITINNGAGAAAVNIQDGGNTITVDGTVNVSNFPTTVDTNYGTVGANTIRSAAQLGNATGAADFNFGTIGAQSVRTAAQIGNATGAANFNAGATGAQTLRTATNLYDGSANAITSQTIGATQSLNVASQGNVASTATDSGNPVKTGAVFNTTLPTVTNGQRVDSQADANGRLITASVPLDGIAKTYSSSVSALGVASLATDILSIVGSSTKIVTIKAIEFSGIRTTAGVVPVSLIKRSTLDTGGGTASLVQFVSTSVTANTTTAAITVASTGAGNLIVIGATNADNRTVNGITDGTTALTQATNAAGNSGAFRADLWYLLSSNSGKTTFTVTFSGTSTTKSVFFWEVSGTGTATFDNANRVNNGVGVSNLDTGATVTSVGPSFIAACISTNGAITVAPAAGNEFTSGGGITALNQAGVSLITGTLNTAHTPTFTDSSAAAAFGASTAAFTFAGNNALTLTTVPHDSTDAAATATIKYYAANPTLGTTVGTVRAHQILVPTTTGSPVIQRWEFGNEGSSKGIILNNQNQSLNINLNSTTVAGANLSISIEWTEA